MRETQKHLEPEHWTDRQLLASLRRWLITATTLLAILALPIIAILALLTFVVFANLDNMSNLLDAAAVAQLDSLVTAQ